MVNGRDWQGWAAFFAGLLISQTTVVVIVVVSRLYPSSICGSSEAQQVCVREWLSVVAAWGALFGGLAAAYFVYKTIAKMNEQLHEARRQTSFIVGDDPPFIEIWTHKSQEIYRFRIVNWNRRILLIARVEWNCSVEYIALPELTGVDELGKQQTREVGPDGFLKTWIDMAGFIDRGKGPPVTVFHQKASLNTWNKLPIDHPPASVRVTGYLLGETREKIVLEAHIQSLMPEHHQQIFAQ